jgi:hypothetical protein
VVITGGPVVQHDDAAALNAPLSCSTGVLATPVVQIDDGRLDGRQTDSTTPRTPRRVVGEADEIRGQHEDVRLPMVVTFAGLGWTVETRLRR